MGKFDVGSETNCLKINEITSKTAILLATYIHVQLVQVC